MTRCKRTDTCAEKENNLMERFDGWDNLLMDKWTQAPERCQYVFDFKVIRSPVHSSSVKNLKCHPSEKLQLEEKWRRRSPEFDPSDYLLITRPNTDAISFQPTLPLRRRSFLTVGEPGRDGDSQQHKSASVLFCRRVLFCVSNSSRFD